MKRSLPPYVYPLGKKGYLYFLRKGICQRMPDDPTSDEFFALYARMREARVISAVPKGKSFHALIAHYKRSKRYTKLADRTTADYDKILSYIDQTFGPLPVAKLRRKDVVRARDSNADAQRFANYIVQVLRVILEHARDIGWREDNPAKGVSLLKSEGAGRKPWPVDMIAAFRKIADDRARLIFELCLGTGQRIGDVLRMRWDHLEAGGIHVQQGKTKRALWIPLTDDLQLVLARTQRRGLYIASDDMTRPLRYHQARHAIAAVRKQIGAEEYPIHSLRYSTASELARLGCSDDLIMAITGHNTVAMVAKYAGAERQKVRAINAQSRRNKKAPKGES